MNENESIIKFWYEFQAFEKTVYYHVISDDNDRQDCARRMIWSIWHFPKGGILIGRRLTESKLAFSQRLTVNKLIGSERIELVLTTRGNKDHVPFIQKVYDMKPELYHFTVSKYIYRTDESIEWVHEGVKKTYNANDLNFVYKEVENSWKFVPERDNASKFDLIVGVPEDKKDALISNRLGSGSSLAIILVQMAIGEYYFLNCIRHMKFCSIGLEGSKSGEDLHNMLCKNIKCNYCSVCGIESYRKDFENSIFCDSDCGRIYISRLLS